LYATKINVSPEKTKFFITFLLCNYFNWAKRKTLRPVGGIPNRFVAHGTIPELYRLCGMDVEGIAEVLVNISI